jgi:hypothetical protein
MTIDAENILTQKMRFGLRRFRFIFSSIRHKSVLIIN